MKIWNGYGSEHSMNLVMIGRFKEEVVARNVKALIDQITDMVIKNDDLPDSRDSKRLQKFSDEMRDFLIESELFLAPSELEQFRYDMRTEVKDKEIVMRTDEESVSGYLKILLDNGAKVEVYSAHTHPENSEEDENDDSGELG